MTPPPEIPDEGDQVADPTVAELKAMLAEQGIDYGRKNSITALQKLLEENANE